MHTNEPNEKLLAAFFENFGDGASPQEFFAPGRVNIIGEHTDYNGGHVLPAPVNLGTTVLIRPRNDNQIHLASTNFPLRMNISIPNIEFRKSNDWANYPLGMVHVFSRAGRIPGGFEALFSGNLPNGAGLSSSASLNVAIGKALNQIFDLGITHEEMARLAQLCENDFVGVNCGIMDPFAIAMGRPGEAVLLNCNQLKFKFIPLNLGEYKIVIVNTNKRRALADSKYNERRAQCDAAVEYLAQKTTIPYLSYISLSDLEIYSSYIPDEILLRRARHVVSEEQRVLNAAKALESGDLSELGRLMSESHASLRDDYEVTGIELDTLVNEALAAEGVLGARMTGAGFGGCAIALAHKDAIPALAARLNANYTAAIGYAPTVYDMAV